MWLWLAWMRGRGAPSGRGRLGKGLQLEGAGHVGTRKECGVVQQGRTGKQREGKV